MMEKKTISKEGEEKMTEQEWKNYNQAWKLRHTRMVVNS